MLSEISWEEYLTAMGILLALYYGYIGIRYYPGEIKRILSGKGRTDKEQPAYNPKQFMQGADEESDQIIDDYDDEGDDEFLRVESLITSLTQAIDTARKKQMIVAELKQYLKDVLREQPTLKDSPFRSSINQLIVSECGKNGTYMLSEQEIDVLWDGVV